MLPQRVTDDAGGGADGAAAMMAGGGGAAWGLARGAFWAAAMVLFARAYCDVVVHPFVHRHITQSGIALYLLHPVVYPAITAGLRNAGVTDTVALYHTATPLTFAACAALYFLANLTPWTAAALGIVPVDFSHRPLGCGGGRRGKGAPTAADDERVITASGGA